MQILGTPARKIIKSVQKGKTVIQSGNSIQTQVISMVDINKSVVVINEGSDQNPPINTCKASGYLSAGNQLYLSTHNAVSGATVETVYWQVIEFYNVKSVQRGQNAYSEHDNNLAISTVDQTKSLLFSSYKTDGANQADGIFGLGITSNTNIEIKKGAFGNATLQWYVVELK